MYSPFDSHIFYFYKKWHSKVVVEYAYTVGVAITTQIV